MKRGIRGEIKISFLILSILIVTNFPFVDKKEKLRKFFAELIKRCDLDLDMQEYDEALNCYLQAISTKPKTKGIHEATGYIYLKKGEYDKAIEEFEKEININERNLASKLLLGISYFMKDDIEKAFIFINETKSKYETLKALKFPRKQLPSFMKFFEENPGLLDFSIGILKKRRGNLLEAESELLSALKKGYKREDCLIQLFDLYIQQNSNEKAIKLLEEIEKEADTSEIGVFENIFSNWNKEKSKELAQRLHFSIKYFKASIRSIVIQMNQKAISFIEKGEIDKGIEFWKKALNADERSFPVNYNLALILFDKGDFKEAREYCRKAIDAGDPYQLHWGYNLMGNIYHQEGRYYEAINEFKKAIEIDRNYIMAHYNLGSSYNMFGDKENAEKEWKFVIEHGKAKSKGKEAEEKTKGEKIEILVFVEEMQPYFYARKYLGFLYLDKGLKEKAIKEFEEALKVTPSDAEIHYELGKTYMGLENKEKAIYHFEIAIKNGTKNEREAKEFLKELRKNEQGL